MKYFTILNCKHDPFPGTPSRALYFPADPHKMCLQNLSSIIKEKKSPLTAVLGPKGVGKTTIYFQLLDKLSNNAETGITSAGDSWFTNRQTFIEHLADFLDISTHDTPTDQVLLKRLKSAITSKESPGKKQRVLLIDQAENIPSYCFELLEEFFTEKVNPDHLQIITFGTEVFKNKIIQYFNLAQNSHLVDVPAKLNFGNIKKLLEYYLDQAGSSFTLDSLISKAGQRYLYLLSKGHPGKALDICKLTLLNLIIQKRSKAGIIFCHQAAREILPERAAKLQRVRISALAIATIGLTIYFSIISQTPDFTAQLAAFTNPQTATLSPPVKNQQEPEPTTSKPEATAKTESSQEIPKESEDASSDKHVLDILKSLQLDEKSVQITQQEKQPSAPIIISKTASKKILPKLLGEISVFEQETLGDMIRRIYGPYSFNPANTEKLLSINPYLKDKHFLSVGDIIQFPSIAVNLTPLAADSWWVRLVTIDKLQDAYRYLRIYASKTDPLLVIPSWDENGSLQFSIVLQHNFPAQDDAKNKLLQLSSNIYPTAELVEGLSHDSFYYSEKKITAQAKAETTSPIIETISQKKKSKPTKQLPPKVISAKHVKLKKVPDLKNEIPKLLGKITLTKGNTLGHMIRGVYGKDSVKQRNINWLADNNRHIKNPNNVSPGTFVTFPVKAVMIPQKTLPNWWIKIDTFTTLQSAYIFLKKHTPKKPWLLIIPTFANKQTQFNLIVELSHKQKKDAKAMIEKLSTDGFQSATLLKGLNSDNYYFKSKKDQSQ
jgi:hypothetical protein